MKLAVVGTGYVGLVSGTCFAEMGNDVICVDVDEGKIKQLKQGVVPILEVGLEAMVLKNIQRGNLSFTTSLELEIKEATVVFIAVGTLMGEDGSADLQFDVVANPEFLKEGAAVADFMKPDRVVIGAESEYAFQKMKELYSPFFRTHERFITMDIRSAEMRLLIFVKE